MSEIILPVTRYYGSKRKLIKKIWHEIESIDINFESVLDIFGGSGVFSYYAKRKGKRVIYNDILRFNHLIGKALIENSSNELTNDEVHELLIPKTNKYYKDIIQKHYKDIYYPEIENKQIDIIVQNIETLENDSKKASAYYLLFQSSLIKRPYNIFHRKNLNLRTNFNGGGFGNKVTWEKSFSELFLKFNNELNELTFTNGLRNESINKPALKCNVGADLVYIDPPYFKGRDHVSYHAKYHFLEGLSNYESIEDAINHSTKNKEILINKSKEFESKVNFLKDLESLILMHRNSILVISYRSNGIPSIPQIISVLEKYKRNIRAIDLGNYIYALNRNNTQNSEHLIIGY